MASRPAGVAALLQDEGDTAPGSEEEESAEGGAEHRGLLAAALLLHPAQPQHGAREACGLLARGVRGRPCPVRVVGGAVALLVVLVFGTGALRVPTIDARRVVGLAIAPAPATSSTMTTTTTTTTTTTQTSTSTTTTTTQTSTSTSSTTTWTSTSTTTTSMTTTTSVDKALAALFPEVDIIWIPDSPTDNLRLAQYVAEADLYIPGGRYNLRLVAGVNPSLWPAGGQYAEAEHWVQRFLTPNPKLGAEEKPQWWRDNQLEMQFMWVDAGGRSAIPDRIHHVGCGMAHFSAWMSARDRGVQTMLVTESDGNPGRFGRSGRTDEFAAVVIETVRRVPRTWDLIHLDKCMRGSSGGPVVTMFQEGWKQPYNLRRWVGGGVAGLAMYLVSAQFLQKVPDVIHDRGYDMVDGWLGGLCGAGVLECYTICAGGPPWFG